MSTQTTQEFVIMDKSIASCALCIALRVIAAAILLQTLYFKFTGAPESVHIFSTIHMEPWGRIGTGFAELCAAVLLLLPRTVVYGAALTIAILLGAIATHLTVLGIVVMNDGGLLFSLAIAATMSCIALLFLYRQDFVAAVHQAEALLRRAGPSRRTLS